MFTATLTIDYEEPDSERDGDDFQRVAQEFQGDMQDPGAHWMVRITNTNTNESRLIDLEELCR